MKFAIFFFYGQNLIFWNYYYYNTNANPLIGENVITVEQNEYIGVVSMQLNLNRVQPITDHICTGTLISNDDVLTAEHCFTLGDQFISFKISAGTTDLLANSYFYPAWWISYTKWASYRNITIRYPENDVAIIRLTKRVETGIQIALTSFLPNPALYGKKVSVAGWSKLTNGTTNRFMQKVNLNVLSNEECEARLNRLRGGPTTLEDMNICTVANPYALLTKGDSGGPLFYDNTVVGLNKATCPYLPHIHDEEKINLHVSLEFYRNFILHVKYSI